MLSFATELNAVFLLVRLGAVLGLHLGLDFTRHQGEGILDVERALGRRLKETDVEVVSQVFRLGVLDLTLVLQILLVANQDAGDVLVGVLVDLAHPLGNLGEGVTISDVVSDDDSVHTTEVARSDGLEAVLADRIPDLELDGLAVDLDGADFEVDSNGGHEVLMEDVVGETQQQRRLTDTGVSNEQHLEEVVAKN